MALNQPAGFLPGTDQCTTDRCTEGEAWGNAPTVKRVTGKPSPFHTEPKAQEEPVREPRGPETEAPPPSPTSTPTFEAPPRPLVPEGSPANTDWAQQASARRKAILITRPVPHHKLELPPGYRSLGCPVALGSPIDAPDEGERPKPSIFRGVTFDQQAVVSGASGRGTLRLVPIEQLAATTEIQHPLVHVDPNRIGRPRSELQGRLDLALEAAPPGQLAPMRYFEKLHERGFPAWVVGGLLRVLIRNCLSTGQSEKAVQDVDIVACAPLLDIKTIVTELMNEGGAGFVDSAHLDTYGMVQLDDGSTDIGMMKSVPLARDLPGGHRVVFGPDLMADASGRDFTINAIYYDPMNRVIVDPTGKGIEDIRNKKLRLIQPVELAGADIVFRYLKYEKLGYSPKGGLLARLRHIAERTFHKRSIASIAARYAPTASNAAETEAAVEAYLHELDQKLKSLNMGALMTPILDRRSEIVERVLTKTNLYDDEA